MSIAMISLVHEICCQQNKPILWHMMVETLNYSFLLKNMLLETLLECDNEEGNLLHITLPACDMAPAII